MDSPPSMQAEVEQQQKRRGIPRTQRDLFGNTISPLGAQISEAHWQGVGEDIPPLAHFVSTGEVRLQEAVPPEEQCDKGEENKELEKELEAEVAEDKEALASAPASAPAAAPGPPPAAAPAAPAAAAARMKCSYRGPRGGKCTAWAVRGKDTCAKHEGAVTGGGAAKPIPQLVIMEGPPLHVQMAKELAYTKDFSHVPAWNHADVFDIVSGMVKRVHRTVGQVSSTMDVYAECGIARQLGLKLRMVTGYKREGDSPLPPCVAAEVRRQVPEYLLGFSVLQCPRMIRYLFFVECPIMVREADLVASHIREFMFAAIKHGIACEELKLYAQDAESVTAFRKRLADRLGLPVNTIKQLINAVGYGNSGEEWKVAVGAADLPAEVKGMKRTLREVCTV